MQPHDAASYNRQKAAIQKLQKTRQRLTKEQKAIFELYIRCLDEIGRSATLNPDVARYAERVLILTSLPDRIVLMPLAY